MPLPPAATKILSDSKNVAARKKAAKKSTPHKKIGSYNLGAMIGKGGMGEILLGKHSILPRPAAIKRLSRNQVQGDFVDRFIREAKVLSQLHHPGIVGLYDLIMERGEHFMILEYVDGFDLAQILEHGAIAANVVAALAYRVADALDYAHGMGVTHRDIKPANCMVSVYGEVKVMDFGIARDADGEKLTRTGMMVGTPVYMAPEIFAGEAAGEASDIYSLGAMMYELLAGKTMFNDTPDGQRIPSILAGKYPSLARAAPGTPRRLRKIVARCLNKRPEKRFKGADELRAALGRYLGEHHTSSAHSVLMLTRFLEERGLVEYVDPDQAALVRDEEEVVVELIPTRGSRVAISDSGEVVLGTADVLRIVTGTNAASPASSGIRIWLFAALAGALLPVAIFSYQPEHFKEIVAWITSLF